jgi:excisionase family DNA binding protein
MENKYLRDKEASQYLGVGKSTIWLFSKQGKIKAIKLSDRVTVWAKSDLDAFIASRMAVSA